MALRSEGIHVPDSIVAPSTTWTNPNIDNDLCEYLSALVASKSLPLASLVALWRHETAADPRPNKALDPTWLGILLRGYRHREQVVSVETHGVNHDFDAPRAPDFAPPRNHNSTHQYQDAVIRSIAEGQADGTYLVVSAAVALGWHQLRFSPFGCALKKDMDPSKAAPDS
ncbi:hypothetical protein F444_07048 [Phytophthora nicotianae P1976]|uniref:Uncharacterized protein n=1 Tax=Phytophthora nicotianae P1976 TaxID=1317066 RepID=A0A081AG13_PHYNI|nr:hypothetical protein F444_07048 [Phytophthora nicotianae P1976]